MSLRAAVWLARPNRVATLSVQRGFSSSYQHDPHHHDSSVEYPREGFSGPFWRNTVALTLLVAGIVNFAPPGLLTGAASLSVDEAPWLTRVLAHYAPSKDLWVKLNEQHLSLTDEIAKHTLLVQGAKKPAVHRYRYPLSFEQVSPHLVPVGGSGDLSDLLVKGDKT